MPYDLDVLKIHVSKSDMFPEINNKSARPEAFPHPHRAQADNTKIGPNCTYTQKCGTGVGTLPQLEAPVKQVLVTNGKLLHSNGTLPSIVKQLVQSTQGNQEERPRPQFPNRFGSSVENLSESLTRSIINKFEKIRTYEGQRLPMSPTSMTCIVFVFINKLLF